ncbi:MAG: glycosyltransferase, partial [Candidatus Colwellbacteria bacterium]|nr:glycosyltransferase [Candidatus Colwellbacteria bacterium]
MRSPGHLTREGRRHHLPVFHLVVGGKVMSMFINPLMWVITASYFIFRAEIGGFIESFFPAPVLYIGVTAFVLGNFMYFYYYMIGCAKRGYDELIKYVFLVPFYWLGMSIAAWKALYEIIVNPHYWAKTMHGLHLLPGKARVGEEVAKPDTEKTVVSTGSVLVGAFMVANALNFAFNALMGRLLTLEEFGVITFLNSVAYFIALFTGALGTTVNYRVSYLAVRYGPKIGIDFSKRALRSGLIVAGFLSLLWVLGANLLAGFFQISQPLLLISFTPVLTLGVFIAAKSGFLQGNLRFLSIAALVVTEATTKLLLGLLLVGFGLSEWVALAIPGSIFITFILVYLLTLRAERLLVSGRSLPLVSLSTPSLHFPRQFFSAALVTKLASVTFLIIDVFLVKHYLSPAEAGEYSLLSLVGKMIFFGGSLLTGFIVTFAARDEAADKNPNRTFYKLFAGTLALTVAAFVVLGPLGAFFIPILLGQKTLALTPYLVSYTFAISLFTIATSIVIFHLARRQYFFSGIALLMSLALYGGITLRHGSITEIINVLTIVSAVQLLLVLSLHLLQKNGRFVLRNLTDILNIIYPLSPLAPHPIAGKRILIFNWRDTRHVFAGGAETYTHELAKRWVKEGYSVTVFCGNDRKSSRNETIDGVHIVRRGGFYLVYLWAFVYYMFKFRGRFDVILDCENGIPFFASLYAKEPVYCLLHHVHQEVFRKYLNLPMAFIARMLEGHLMPWAYRNVGFITISDSSREGMKELGLIGAGIEIIHPGVNLKELSPGPKHERPTILYLGRLKAYKSVHVLIQAFKRILERMPEARLVIAGSGEEQNKLEKLTAELDVAGQVEFTGKVTEEEKVRLLQEAWVFVNPSYIEGWGITTIEANACGTPVVAADVPGLRDSVNNPHCGLLVEHGNHEAFAEAIHSL